MVESGFAAAGGGGNLKYEKYCLDRDKTNSPEVHICRRPAPAFGRGGIGAETGCAA
jgi:hypothetical protein